MIDLGRRPRKCRLCKSFDHDVRKCPERVPADAPATLPADRVDTIARLRERRDALQVELGEYERVKAHVDARIDHNRAEIIALDREIERLRGAP